jgi:hypothetical protein
VARWRCRFWPRGSAQRRGPLIPTFSPHAGRRRALVVRGRFLRRHCSARNEEILSAPASRGRTTNVTSCRGRRGRIAEAVVMVNPRSGCRISSRRRARVLSRRWREAQRLAPGRSTLSFAAASFAAAPKRTPLTPRVPNHECKAALRPSCGAARHTGSVSGPDFHYGTQRHQFRSSPRKAGTQSFLEARAGLPLEFTPDCDRGRE